MPAWKDSGARGKLELVRKIAVDPQIPPTELPDTTCEQYKGPKRLMSPQNANLMVVGSAARLHSCGPSARQHLCDLIYIIGLGLPVVVASTWRIAGGDTSRLAAQASGIFLHASAAKNKVCTFMLVKVLVDEHPYLREALQYCAAQPQSQWKVVLDKGRPLAANQVRATTISELATAILQLRTLEEDGCRVYALGPGFT